MKFSLWIDDKYVQSSDDERKLKCNVTQLRTWCESMGIESMDGNVQVRDNKADAVLYQADYRTGGALHWKAPAPKSDDPASVA